MKTTENDNPIRIDDVGGSTTIRRLGKLLIGAQITAMTSGVEAFGMIIIGLSLILINESMDSKLVVTALFRFLQNIVLPYIYLINTRENRNRIHQDGWIAILPKFLHIGNMFPSKRSNAVFPLNEIAGVNASNIYTIEKKMIKKGCNKSDPENISLQDFECELNVSFNEIPSSSINYQGNSNSNSLSNRPRISTDSSVESVIIKTDIPKKRTEILDAMLLCLYEETKYLRLFAQFNHLEAHEYEEQALCTIEMIDQEIILHRFMKIFETDKFPNRSELRKEKLHTLKNSINDEAMYQKALDELIDIEETFLDNE